MSRGMPNLLACSGRLIIPFSKANSTGRKDCAPESAHRPDDFDALHLLGMLHFQRHRLVDALRFLARALKVNSSSADALSNFGLALHATGRYDEAISSYSHALDLAPDHPEILYNLGNAYLALDNADDALSNYDHVLAIAPGHVGALVNRGNALLRLNQPVKAMASYDAALASLPGHPQILTNRGHTLRRLDKPVEALAEFRAALAAAPEFPEAHFEAAMAQLSMGDFDAGWKAYEWRWKTGAFAGIPHRPRYRCGGARRRLPARPFCSTPNRALATPFSSSAMRRCWPGGARRSFAKFSRNCSRCCRTAQRHHVIAAGEPLRLRSALSLAQSSPRVRHAARDHPGRGSLSRGARRAAGLLARSSAAGAPARRICLVWPAVAQERRQPLDPAGASGRAV